MDFIEIESIRSDGRDICWDKNKNEYTAEFVKEHSDNMNVHLVNTKKWLRNTF